MQYGKRGVCGGAGTRENARDVGRAWKKWGGMGGKESISPPSRVHVPVRPQTTPWPAREEKDTVAKEAPEWRQEAYACAPQHTQATPRGERGGGGGGERVIGWEGKRSPTRSTRVQRVTPSMWLYAAGGASLPSFFGWELVGRGLGALSFPSPFLFDEWRVNPTLSSPLLFLFLFLFPFFPPLCKHSNTCVCVCVYGL